MTAPGGSKGEAIDRHWRAASARAAAVARGVGHGTLPLGVERAFGLADSPTLDWRTILWRFLSPTATDFAAFDRRHVHQGLYLETLEDQSLCIAVVVDTSGSITDEAVSALINEVRAVLGSYPSIQCWLFYAGAELYGPWPLTISSEIPPAQGGGGTDFRPFFTALAHLAHDEGVTPSVCVYLTDGFGEFPDEAPEVPILWAVVPGASMTSASPSARCSGWCETLGRTDRPQISAGRRRCRRAAIWDCCSCWWRRT